MRWMPSGRRGTDWRNELRKWKRKLQQRAVLGGVKSIGSYAFSGCTGMTSLSFINSETIIEDHAFDGCDKVITLNLDKVKTIGVKSFKSLGIELLTIPSSVTAIGEKAFSTCSKLESLNYPNHEIEFESNMFEGITTLKHISITSTSSGPMQPYTTGNKPWQSVITTIETITINTGVTSVSDYAFEGATNLITIASWGSVTTIGQHAFDGCSTLPSLTISDSVTSIGVGSFKDCIKISSVSFGKGESINVDKFIDDLSNPLSMLMCIFENFCVT